MHGLNTALLDSEFDIIVQSYRLRHFYIGENEETVRNESGKHLFKRKEHFWTIFPALIYFTFIIVLYLNILTNPLWSMDTGKVRFLLTNYILCILSLPHGLYTDAAVLYFKLRSQQGLLSICGWTITLPLRWLDHNHGRVLSGGGVNAQWGKAFLGDVEHFGVPQDDKVCMGLARWGKTKHHLG